MIQSNKKEHWLDEQGNKRPRKYISKLESKVMYLINCIIN